MPTRKSATVPKSQKREVARHTLYFDLGLANRLDLAQAQLRALAGAQRARVSASLVIELALSQALADFETNKETSAVAIALLERIGAKKP
jgi:hypothetical protein